MTWLLIYALIGVTNYVIFLAEGKSEVSSSGATALEILVEAAFFILAWPVQALFAILVGINMASEWLLEKIMG